MEDKMKLIIAGSRSITDYNVTLEAFNKLIRDNPTLSIDEIVSGTANGPDSHAIRIAKERNIRVAKFPADWNMYGKRAGYVRNSEMARYADGLLAVYDGNSRGTKMMIELMQKANKFISVYNPNTNGSTK
jgi:hypothetical protein